MYHARAYGLVGEFVDHNESAEALVLSIRSERYRPVEAHVYRGDFIESQRTRGESRTGVNIQPMSDLRDRHSSKFAMDQCDIRATRQQRVLAHTQQIRLELVGELDWM